MNIKHRNTGTRGTSKHVTRWTLVVAYTVTIAALAAVPSSATETRDGDQRPYTRQCFIEQPRWNVALDGPVPRCPGTETASGTATEPGDTLRSDSVDAWLGGMARVR
ncbi:hypothetical protein [Nocardioides sp. P5_E3]